jgi:hypothetical protein
LQWENCVHGFLGEFSERAKYVAITFSAHTLLMKDQQINTQAKPFTKYPLVLSCGTEIGPSEVRALPVRHCRRAALQTQLATINGIIGRAKCVRQRLALHMLVENVVGSIGQP